jgi:hypothetical protein
MWIFLSEILPASTRNTSILWRVDNTTALAHIRKEGGLRGRRLLWEAERILLLLHSRRLRVLPAFIPSEENLQADAASRFQMVPDWHLGWLYSHRISPLVERSGRWFRGNRKRRKRFHWRQMKDKRRNVRDEDGSFTGTQPQVNHY